MYNPNRSGTVVPVRGEGAKPVEGRFLKSDLRAQVEKELASHSDLKEGDIKLITDSLIQKHLMVSMFSDELQQEIFNGLADDSPVMHSLLSRWAEKYGESFRYYANNLPSDTEEDIKFSNRFRAGSLTPEDCSKLILDLENIVKVDDNGVVEQGGLFFKDDDEAREFVSPKTYH